MQGVANEARSPSALALGSSQKRFEKLLTLAETGYEKSETWIPSEQLYEVLYSFDEVSTELATDENELARLLASLQEQVNDIAARSSSVETSFTVQLTGEIISQKFVELPEDCDTSRVITLVLQGVFIEQAGFWEVVENTYPQKDLISWNGLNLADLARVGDKITISYYRKV